MNQDVENQLGGYDEKDRAATLKTGGINATSDGVSIGCTDSARTAVRIVDAVLHEYHRTHQGERAQRRAMVDAVNALLNLQQKGGES